MNTPKFFKKSNNTDHAEEFKKCMPVNVNTSFVTMAPAIATAEQQRIKPILGTALFDEAATYYDQNGTTGSSNIMNELVSLIQMAVVRLAYWDSFDQLAVMISDRGISDTNGDNRVYRYQADALRESLMRQGYSYLNQAIGLCLDNIGTLQNFTSSEYYSERQSSTIRTMKEMEKIVSLNGDFCVFARLREYIEETEKMELPFRIGSTLAAKLMTEREEQRISTLLRSAQGFVAHWSMADAVPLLGVVMTPQGPMVTSEQSSNGGKVTNAPGPAMIADLQKRHREMAERYIGQLVTFCKQHTDTYPEISEIGISTDHEKTAMFRDNKNKKTFLV